MHESRRSLTNLAKGQTEESAAGLGISLRPKKLVHEARVMVQTQRDWFLSPSGFQSRFECYTAKLVSRLASWDMLSAADIEDILRSALIVFQSCLKVRLMQSKLFLPVVFLAFDFSKAVPDSFRHGIVRGP